MGVKLPPWLWKRLTSRRFKRFLIIGPFVLIFGSVLAYVLADAWGRHRFEVDVAALKAAGMPVTADEAFGPLPAPEEDFFQHPAVVGELAQRDSLEGIGHMKIPGILDVDARSKSVPEINPPMDFRKWLASPRAGASDEQLAGETLLLVHPLSLRFDAIVDALQRPRAGWYPGGKPEDLALSAVSKKAIAVTRWAKFAEDRVTLELAAGESGSAFLDVRHLLDLEHRFAEARVTPMSAPALSLLDNSVRRAISEGIARRAWNDGQLAELQARVGEMDFNKVIITALRVDVAASIGRVRDADADPGHFRPGIHWLGAAKAFGNGLVHGDGKEMRRSWEIVRPWGLEMAATGDELLRLKTEVIDRHTGVAFTVADCRDSSGAVEEPMLRWIDLGSSRNSLMLLSKLVVGEEVKRSLTLTGIALERYRLKHGATPESLQAVVPEFLPAVPADPQDGKPIRYQRKPGGGADLWSLWPSGQEDGKPNPSKDINTLWTIPNVGP